MILKIEMVRHSKKMVLLKLILFKQIKKIVQKLCEIYSYEKNIKIPSSFVR